MGRGTHPEDGSREAGRATVIGTALAVAIDDVVRDQTQRLPFLTGRERALHYAYMGYAVVTILGWVALGARNILGYSDKIVEILLILALWQHLRLTEKAA